ncbi:palmitoyl-protein thioesterase 1 [Lichtheimia corymbifera JMRC:FSU:9682]|uniref:Palmitoyl-protein thioesterase 1 n=1 Tax=Lichtheimia corymbifera JMRC:FSU:9682 TaxID=1263082 RepID=A0A068RZ88_9FUNG|nr:palmitoyl-protein thioesterase 1 [Lichtheimia corymbifera JMRC:FSU:9682]
MILPLALFSLIPLILPLAVVSAEPVYKPVVLWHGMGDDCCNPQSMGRVTELIQKVLPGVFVHSVQVGETRQDDHEAGFFGQVNDQVEQVCEQLAGIPELADGFNAIGFSQGGLFLRAYVQRCNRPAVHRLITFGSPHGAVRFGVYTGYVQHRVVQAQYYKDPRNLQGYLDHNVFLPDINNELGVKNETYRDNLSQLEYFIMVRFADDSMVKPSETAWFWTYDENEDLVPLDKQDMFREDWLGLQRLGARLRFLVSPGQHMEISDDFLETEIIHPYLASPETSAASIPAISTPRFISQP